MQKKELIRRTSRLLLTGALAAMVMTACSPAATQTSTEALKSESTLQASAQALESESIPQASAHTAEPESIPQTSAPAPANALSARQIYLYGEIHGTEVILDKEFELWHEYYHDHDMRHLFIEVPYYTGELLNLWMQEDDDEILDTIYDNLAGTPSHVPQFREFYKKIKDQCPQTIFYGTDVGHQYGTTGKWYLSYLEEHGLTDSEPYHIAEETMEQGRYYYTNQDNPYRENKMAENFIREYDKLGDEPIMGIYGAAHIDPDAMEYTTGSVPSMANQLRQYYGDIIQAEDLSWMVPEEMLNTEPLRTDTIQIHGKDYEASYFGNQDISAYFEDFASRDFWRLEQAYEDFKDAPLAGDKLPYDNYPMEIEPGQVFVIDYTQKDGSVLRMYYRSTDGCMLENRPATEAFTIPSDNVPRW